MGNGRKKLDWNFILLGSMWSLVTQALVILEVQFNLEAGGLQCSICSKTLIFLVMNC